MSRFYSPARQMGVRRVCAMGAFLALSVAAMETARAQDNDAAQAATPPAGAAPVQAEPGKTQQVAPAKTARDPAVFARFDELREPMLTTRFPSLMDTVTGDAGGW